ncbi:hypothetical protein O7627_36955 [Solwaraspora sp. WMMD1047]|uniref:hypothetical protein n=1 Tax=Solwaraspora sp. WMMD1047 TaxID=3016102 RepID=UPI002417F7F4|nr:hypothetical protein [Solwaraspora sp. WMMD1047]MDG4834861.1 hypothetical protein [Solwaraspora sp. WMMD1047]
MTSPCPRGRQVTAAVLVLAALTATITDSTSPSRLPPADPLLALADRLHPVGEEAAGADEVIAGGYGVHLLRRWSVTTTGWPSTHPDQPISVAVEEQRWTAPDGSGWIMSRHNDPDPTLASARPTHRSLDAEFGRRPWTVATFPPGALTGGCTQPWPCPGSLPEPPRPDLVSPDPAQPLNDFVFVHTRAHLGPADTAAALRILADTEGLTYQHRATDRLGRSGLGVVLDAPPIRHRLILHPDTGRLLTAEQQLTGAHPFLPVGPPTVIEYILVVSQRHRGPGQQATLHTGRLR